jgi:hypothetical protein
VPDDHHDPSAALIPVAPVFTSTERLALAGFLAGYGGLTRQAYELHLRQYASWCHQHHLRLFQARRADIECFARDLETRGRARAAMSRMTSPARSPRPGSACPDRFLSDRAAALPLQCLGYAFGWMFWLTRKALSGS